MTKKRKLRLGIVIALLLLGAWTFVVGSEHARHMKEAYIEIILTPRAPGEVVGPLQLDQSACHYLRPTVYTRPIQWVTCYECVLQARDIDRIYSIAPMTEECPSRGTVGMTFIRR